MKPTLGKRKNVRGRIIAHSAQIGPITVEGESPADAAETCERATLDALARLSQGAYVKRWRGHVAIVAPTTTGWEYWIDAFRDDYTVQCGENRVAAMASALHHLAQGIWDPETQDGFVGTADEYDRTFVVNLPSDVAEEIARWIRWQRSYAALRAEGKTDVEAHRLASDGLFYGTQEKSANA